MRRYLRKFTIAVSILASVFLQPGAALAVANYDLVTAVNDTTLFDTRDYSCVTGTDDGTEGVDTPLAGNDNVEKAYRFFIGKGLTPANAAGILGNLIQESNVNPGAVNTAGGTGGSIAQWEGPRWDEFLAFAKKTKGSSHALATQLNFMWAELTGTSGVAKQPGLSAMKGINDAADAAEAFELAYERAGKPMMSNRRDNAKRVYQLAARKGWNSVGVVTDPAAGTTADPAASEVPAGSCATPVSPGATTTTPGGTVSNSGDVATLAKQVLSNSRIHFVTSDAKEEMTLASQGKKSPVPCKGTSVMLKPALLNLMLALAKDFTYNVGYITNGCHATHSVHYSGGAMDVDGATTPGGQVPNAKFAQAAANLMPKGGGVGQKGCSGMGSVKVPSGVRYFADTCNHQHLDVGN